MTNIIGMALIVLNVQTQHILETNAYMITCEQAGCTNWFWRDVDVIDEPAVYDYGNGMTNIIYNTNTWTFNSHDGLFHPPEIKILKEAKTHKETVKSCIFLHQQPYIWTNVTRTIMTMGTDKNNPLFKIINQKVHKDKEQKRLYISTTYYREGIFLQSYEE